jgi:hypothetical protein
VRPEDELPGEQGLDGDEGERRKDRGARAGFVILLVVGTAALFAMFLIFGGMSRGA